MAWYVDKGLARLIQQWKKLHPGAVVGTIGDPSHQSGTSDHNPEEDGSVDAGDFMPGNGVSVQDLDDLLDALMWERDPRIAYMIRRQHIVSSRPIGKYEAWQWRPYSGHYHGHLHVSVNDLHENDGSDWNIGGKDPVVMEEIHGALPVLTFGMRDPIYKGAPSHVNRAQRLLGVEADGVYGPETAGAVNRLDGSNNGRTINGALWERLIALRPVDA